MLYNDCRGFLCEIRKLTLGNKRISSLTELNDTISSWESERNRKQKGVDWQFTTEDARVKLKRLYPTPMFDD